MYVYIFVDDLFFTSIYILHPSYTTSKTLYIICAHIIQVMLLRVFLA